MIHTRRQINLKVAFLCSGAFYESFGEPGDTSWNNYRTIYDPVQKILDEQGELAKRMPLQTVLVAGKALLQ